MDDVDPIKLEKASLDRYLTEVNSLLRLIQREDRAMLMPMLIHHYIWGHLDTDEIQHMRSLPPQQAVDILVKKMPWFLRYHQKVMRDDAMVIMQHHLFKQKPICSG